MSPGAAGAVVAAHVHPGVPWGALSVEAGPVNASCDNLRISVEGVGRHGAHPHLARDPIKPAREVRDIHVRQARQEGFAGRMRGWRCHDRDATPKR